VVEGQLALVLFAAVCILLMLGFPVAFTLAGTSLIAAALGTLSGFFDPSYLSALPARIFGTMGNETLIAVPLFILMGNILERARIAEDLLSNMAKLFGRRPGGLGVSVVLVGALLAASTGIVGATVVTMGLLSLPTMLRAGYSPALASGTIAATGTLGQIIPPSIALVLLGDLLNGLIPPLLLIALVLGSILVGAATPTEAAGVGAIGALLLAVSRGEMNISRLREIGLATLRITSMVFMILIGAAVFSLVFRGFGGDHFIESFFQDRVGHPELALLIVMVVIFLLGFILDFIEITFVVVPIVGPILLAMGFDPIWLGIMIAINLQTSFLTPPFGFALFYLRGVAPESVQTTAIYKGVIPFIIIQLLLLGALWQWPMLITWLPSVM